MNVVPVRLFGTAPREPSLSVSRGAGTTFDRRISVVAPSMDAIAGHANVFEMQVWGDIDPYFRRGEFAATEGAAKWVKYHQVFDVVLTPGSGAKTVSVKLRNSSRVETAVLTATTTFDDRFPHATVLWSDDIRVLRADATAPLRFGWSASVAYELAAVRLCTDPDAVPEDGVTLIEFGAGAAGSHNLCVIDQLDVVAGDLLVTQGGQKTIKVFIYNGDTWYSGPSPTHSGPVATLTWDESNWDEGVWE